MRNILHANNHPQRAASELGFHDVAELNNNVRVDFEQQKIINDNDETKITSNNNSVKVNGSKTSFIKSQTKNNKNLFIIKKLKKLEINTEWLIKMMLKTQTTSNGIVNDMDRPGESIIYVSKEP